MGARRERGRHPHALPRLAPCGYDLRARERVAALGCERLAPRRRRVPAGLAPDPLALAAERLVVARAVLPVVRFAAAARFVEPFEPAAVRLAVPRVDFALVRLAGAPFDFAAARLAAVPLRFAAVRLAPV